MESELKEKSTLPLTARRKSIYKSFSLNLGETSVNPTPIAEKSQHLGSREIVSDVGGLFGVKPLLLSEDTTVTDPAIQYKGVIDHLK